MAAAEEYPDLETCDVCAPWGSLGITKRRGTPQCGSGKIFVAVDHLDDTVGRSA